MFDAKISSPPRSKTAERSNRGGHHCRDRLFDLPAPEENQALLHLNPSLCGMRDNRGIADITR
jgi:hypothetical protein